MIKMGAHNICRLLFCVLSFPVFAKTIVNAECFPYMQEYVKGSNKIYQAKNSKWCVPTCLDIATVYISRIAEVNVANISIKSGILTDGSVYNKLSQYNLTTDDEPFKAVSEGSKILGLVAVDSRDHLKSDFVPVNDHRPDATTFEFLKNTLYRQLENPKEGELPWKSREKVTNAIFNYLGINELRTDFCDKADEDEVNAVIASLVGNLDDTKTKLLYSLENAISCLLTSSNFLSTENELNRWFQSTEIKCKCEKGNIPRQNPAGDSKEKIRNDNFQAIVDLIQGDKSRSHVIILDFACDTEKGGDNHACIVTGLYKDDRPGSTGEMFLEVYNPDPSYSKNNKANPMSIDKTLTYSIGGKTKVVSRYFIITWEKEEGNP